MAYYLTDGIGIKKELKKMNCVRRGYEQKQFERIIMTVDRVEWKKRTFCADLT